MSHAINQRAYIYKDQEPNPVQLDGDIPRANIVSIPEEDDDPMPAFPERRPDGPRSISIDALTEGAGEKPLPRFKITQHSQIAGASETFDFVENILCDKTLGCIYAPPGLMKSFLVLELARCIATGANFGPHETEQGGVLYCAFEGENGVKNRLAALRKSGRLPDDAPLSVCFDLVHLLKDGDAEAFVQAVTDSGQGMRLIILDTLSRALAGGDENAAKDMTQAIESADRIKNGTGAAVLLIHHAGKDVSKGSRGHSSLKGALDSEFEISDAGDDIRILRSAKQKDLPLAPDLPFRGELVHLGINRRGKSITSLVVEWVDPADVPASKTGRTAKVSSDDVFAALADGDRSRIGLIDHLKAKHGAGETACKRALDTARMSGEVVPYRKLDPRTGQNVFWFKLAKSQP
jgi:hypothetical protein